MSWPDLDVALLAGRVMAGGLPSFGVCHDDGHHHPGGVRQRPTPLESERSP